MGSCRFLLTGIVSADPEKSDWIPLFNDKDFEGWTFDILDDSKPETIWSIKDGTVVVSGKGKSTGVMRTAKDYANYELQFEWRWPDEPGNSGLLLHCGKPRERNVWPHSLEVQLLAKGRGTVGQARFTESFKRGSEWTLRVDLAKKKAEPAFTLESASH